jgi:hypothetical protein
MSEDNGHPNDAHLSAARRGSRMTADTLEAAMTLA